jgi:uncharacterized protein YcsI (UPF0317 family)
MSRYLDCSSAETVVPESFRQLCRDGIHTGPTSGHCLDYVQANVVFLPKEYSYDFLLFCQRNPKPCPLLEVTETQTPEIFAPSADLYTDIPRYNILRDGKIIESKTEILEYKAQNLVAFLLGCSFSFEQALISSGIPVRHIEENKNVPMYITDIDCRPSGIFRGPLIVTMRPIPKHQVNLAIEITSKFPSVHGAPVHKGDPRSIGIKDLATVDYGDPVTINPDEIPVFWACGVTPMQSIIQAQIPFAITHSPGHMFVTDRTNSSLDISNITFKYESS